MSKTSRRALALTALTAILSLPVALLAPPADAVSTRSFVLDDAASLAAGELEGTAVHSDGSVTIGVQTRRIGLDEAALAWSFARGSGSVFIGTGNDGKIYRLSGDDVTECLGGAHGLTDEDLSVRYETMCDPRLNAAQSLDLAFMVAERLRV